MKTINRRDFLKATAIGVGLFFIPLPKEKTLESITKDFENRFNTVRDINTEWERHTIGTIPTYTPKDDIKPKGAVMVAKEYAFGCKKKETALKRLENVLKGILRKSDRDIVAWRVKPYIELKYDIERNKKYYHSYFRVMVT